MEPGREVNVDGPLAAGAGEPGAAFLVKGLSTELLDPNGEVVTGSFEHHGSIQNFCETLA